MRSAWGLCGLLVLASVLYCSWLFTGFDHWGRGDWDQFRFRYETPRLAWLRDGQVPLWNPYVGGGNVLLAHPHCPALSPWYIPTLLLGAPLGLRLSVLLFVTLGATGMAALLRRWEISLGGCFAGGVLLMMSTHFALHITEGHLEWCALGLMPWVLLCLVQAQRDWRFALLGALLFASALLSGSIYVVVVFAPVFILWAVFEGIRTSSWRVAVGSAAAMGLTALLCAVVLLPRIEFLRTNPRRTRQDEQVAPTAFARMLLDPRQADFFRQTRDIRNPPDAELDRLLPAQSGAPTKSAQTLKWHRLEVVLSTTSDWTDVRFQNFPYRLFVGGLGAEEKTPAELNAMPQTNEWLAIKAPDLEKSKQTARATLYVRLPDRGDLELLVTRGNTGATRLTITRGDEVVLDKVHAVMEPGDLTNARTIKIPRHKMLGREPPDQPGTAGPWYRIEATLRTTAAWSDLQVVNSPYVFQVKRWKNRGQTEIQPSMSALATGSRRPGRAEALLEATLYVQCPEEDRLRLAILQGPVGESTLALKDPQGRPLAPRRNELTGRDGPKTVEYVLPTQALRKRLEPLPTPLRWRLNRLGMRRDWHEYGCYVTWIGLAVAGVGLVVSFRRQWPLLVTGLLAGLVVLGAALPLNLWALWKQLPMYGSLQVPSRFLVAVVFVLAVCGGYGVDRLGRWAERIGGVWLRRALVCGVGLAIYLELAVLGRNLLSDIFVHAPRPVPHHEQFAQRFADDDPIRYPTMYSALCPYLRSNSGVLRGYENIAVPPGDVRIEGDPDYRGEVYLEDSQGTAEITDWSMSRVKVALDVDGPDRLVLNQNHFRGWKVIRRGASGTAEKLPAEPWPAQRGDDRPEQPGALVSIAVQPGDRQVEFYYLPDSFVRGATVSGLTLLGCLGLLVAGSRKGWKSFKPVQSAAAMARRCRRALRSPAAAYVGFAVALNVPFLVCHPGWTFGGAPSSPWFLQLVRSLGVNVVLFLAPGLPLVSAMIGRGRTPRLHLLWVIVASFAVFVVVLSVTQLAGPLDGSVVWNGTWALTNLAIVLSIAAGGPPAWGIRLRGGHWRVAAPLFAVAYLLLFVGATRVVPPMQDHDLDIQSPGYALLTRFEPEVVNDRKLLYYFAHPLLLNCYEAASFLYYGQLDHLARFDFATERVRRAEAQRSIVPVVGRFRRLNDGRLVRDQGDAEEAMTRHRIVGVRQGSYLIEPPLESWQDRENVRAVPVREFEVQILYDDYHRDPRRLPTRTPNTFLGALTVALLGCWFHRWAGRWWFALLVPLAYATGPEVFVRSSYGGYFTISMFALVQILLAVEQSISDRSRAASLNCFLAGTFAALANNKLVLLPAALLLWQFFRLHQAGILKRAARAVGHPVVLGFAVGTAAFWAYGLAVSPEAFIADYARIHLVDRILHHENPYQGYPDVPGLWRQFGQHTGYVLLPVGILLLGILCWQKDGQSSGCQTGRMTRGWRNMPGLWAAWALLTAVAFSLIDWRQTKHLMPLLLPLHLAAARWAASGRTALILISALFAALLLWNLQVLQTLADGFDAFPIRPAPDW